jgi:hypothetical protein
LSYGGHGRGTWTCHKCCGMTYVKVKHLEGQVRVNKKVYSKRSIWCNTKEEMYRTLPFNCEQTSEFCGSLFHLLEHFHSCIVNIKFLSQSRCPYTWWNSRTSVQIIIKFYLKNYVEALSSCYNFHSDWKLLTTTIHEGIHVCFVCISNVNQYVWVHIVARKHFKDKHSGKWIKCFTFIFLNKHSIHNWFQELCFCWLGFISWNKINRAGEGEEGKAIAVTGLEGP